MKEHLDKIKMNLILSVIIIMMIVAVLAAVLAIWYTSTIIFGFFHNSWDPTSTTQNFTIGGIIFSLIYGCAILIRRSVEKDQRKKNQTKQSSSMQS